MNVEMNIPQPPPDAPAPRPGAAARRSRKAAERRALLVLFVVGAVVASAIVAFRVRSLRAADRTQAINNFRLLGQVLQNFEADYGRYPDASTVAEVKRVTGTTWKLGSGSSNELYRQLIVAGCVKLEKPFRAKAPCTLKADDVFHDEAHALAPGEVGSAYIAGLSSTSPVDAPVIVAPLIPGSTRFERKSYDKRAVVLKVSGAAYSTPVGRDGIARERGMDLFDPAQAFWGGKPPEIKWPEVKPGYK